MLYVEVELKIYTACLWKHAYYLKTDAVAAILMSETDFSKSNPVILEKTPRKWL